GLDFSRAYLKLGSSLPETSGSGTLFMKLGSPACARRVLVRAAVTPAANAAAPFRKSRRWNSGMESPSLSEVSSPPPQQPPCGGGKCVSPGPRGGWEDAGVVTPLPGWLRSSPAVGQEH